MENITIITAHYKDFPWIELLIKQIRSNTSMSDLCEIIIINQDRCAESRDRLLKLDDLVRVVEYPISEKHFQIQGHDHAAVLNVALLEALGRYICVFDSDAHPISPNWVNVCREKLTSYDALLAISPSEYGTHPCFMVLKKEHTEIPLAFDEGLFADRIDTGRLIGDQLLRAGQKVLLLEPRKCFSGLWGTSYLNIVYHHGNGSFHLSAPILVGQVTWFHSFFRERVLCDSTYELTYTRAVQCLIVTCYTRFVVDKLRNLKAFLSELKKKVFAFF